MLEDHANRHTKPREFGERALKAGRMLRTCTGRRTFLQQCEKIHKGDAGSLALGSVCYKIRAGKDSHRAS